ncbi:uncharacterized protein LOC122712654 [Apis laboriosa]|uniref:uncharacterized protein LOC122712654 n=1 Tax=Apis laboriosa TaxID=183418 RepID=UPI001CC6AD45|nr:uncharacterized protein LOC122712654 [Apis laboriosa]XP_043788398.1 uncharacterized protein LOC122712654 [Apis laboriosa]
MLPGKNVYFTCISSFYLKCLIVQHFIQVSANISKRGEGNQEISPIPSLGGWRGLEYGGIRGIGRRKVIVLDPKDLCALTEESAAASYFDRVAGRHVGDNEALSSASDVDHRSCDNYGETRLRRLTFTGSNFPRIPGTLRGRNTDILKRVK